MTYRKHLISLLIGWLLMAAVAVLVLGTATLKVVAFAGGSLVLLSLAVAFVLEHGGAVIRKWRANERSH